VFAYTRCSVTSTLHSRRTLGCIQSTYEVAYPEKLNRWLHFREMVSRIAASGRPVRIWTRRDGLSNVCVHHDPYHGTLPARSLQLYQRNYALVLPCIRLFIADVRSVPPFQQAGLTRAPVSGRAIATSAILGLPAVIAFAGIFLLSFAGAGAHFGSKTHEVSVPYESARR